MAGMDDLKFGAPKFSKASAAEYSSSESDAEDEDEYLLPSRNPHDAEFTEHHNPRKRRRTGRDAKESAALGIFGSESEDEGPDRKWKRKPLRSKGVSFVSSAQQAKDSDEDEEDEDDQDASEDERPSMNPISADDNEYDYEDDDDDAGGVGLGFGGAAAAAAAQGLGWAPSNNKPQPEFKTQTRPTLNPQAKSFVKSSGGAVNPLGSGFVPTSEMGPTLLAKDDEPTTPRAALPSAFSKGKGGRTKINPGSFGARMMAKMGYVEGKGLGKEGQGRNVIIEANLRPQGIGLGAVKEKTEQERREEKRQARLRGEVVEDSEEEERKKKAARKKKSLAGGVGSLPGSGTSTPKRQKPRYMTMDEVKKAAPGLSIPDAFTPILDLTGPGKKLLTTSSGLMTPNGTAVPAETPEDAEARKLARRAQNDFMAILEEWQSLQERKRDLELQLQHEQEEMEQLAASVLTNLSLTNKCEELSQPPESGEFDKKADISFKLGRILTGLASASNSVSDSMLPQIQEELGTLAVAAIHPTFKEYVQLWKPLEEPKPGFVDGLMSIRALLGLDQPKKKGNRRFTATPFETMMYKLWLPTVATAVREWDVKEPDQLIAVFEAWDKLIPRFIRAQLIDQDVVRKLEEAVQKWLPKKKHTHSLPHGWIFPWLPYLSSTHLDPKSSTGLVADVKRKFRALVDVWEFRRGVIPGLKQWKEVLRPSRSQDQWGPLVMNHILPGMARYLKANFKVNPQDQEPYVEMLDGVLKWLDVLRPSMVGEVIVSAVFPMWHDALYHWLLVDDPNYEEIGHWFQWWQDDVFPEEIKSLPSITAEFTKGTAMIERALDLGDRAKAELKPPEMGPALPTREKHRGHYHKHRDRQHPGQSTPVKDAAPAAQEEVSFRHVIEDWCQENDLQFIPERKKVHAEGPLYRITARGDGKGGVLVYFKDDVLYFDAKDKNLKLRRDEDYGSLLDLAS